MPRVPCRTPATVGARRAPWRPLRDRPVDGSHGSNDPSRIRTIQHVPLPHGLIMLLWTDNFKLFSPIALMASFVLVALYNVKRGPYRYDFALSDPARDHRPSKRRPLVDHACSHLAGGVAQLVVGRAAAETRPRRRPWRRLGVTSSALCLGPRQSRLEPKHSFGGGTAAATLAETAV